MGTNHEETNKSGHGHTLQSSHDYNRQSYCDVVVQTNNWNVNGSAPFNVLDTPYVPLTNFMEQTHVIPPFNNPYNRQTLSGHFETQLINNANAALHVPNVYTNTGMNSSITNAFQPVIYMQNPQHLQANVQQINMQVTQPQAIHHNTLPDVLRQQQMQQQQLMQQQMQQHQQQRQQQRQVPFPLTVQDRPQVPPTYNGVNPNYPGLRILHKQPPIFAVDNFLTAAECEFLINSAQGSFIAAPVVGPGSGEVSKSRTSSTCYLSREDLPLYMSKICALTGKPIDHCELPQVGRYLPSQQYLQHFDAFDLSDSDGLRFASNGGQRTITILVYLNDVREGGKTRFPSLNLDVQPQRGMALVFFPATVDGLLDKLALHAALPAVDVKYVSQVWVRQGRYEGQPSIHLSRRMDEGVNQTFNESGDLLNTSMDISLDD